METKKLLELRKKIKKKKPIFVRRDSHKVVRVEPKWRQPRGRHSSVRQKHKGRPKLVSIGFSSPREVRHLHSSGLKKVIVSHSRQLDCLDPLKEGVVISRTVGNIKRKELIKLALAKKLKILNFKNPEKKIEEIEAGFKERKDKQRKKVSEKEAKEEESKKLAEKAEKEKKENDKKEPTPETLPESHDEKEEKDKELQEIKEKTLIKKQ